MKNFFTSVMAALFMAAPVGNLSAQTSQQLTKSQEEAIKKELLPVVFEQIKEQAGIDILGWATPKLNANTLSGIPVLESSNLLRAANTNEKVNVKPDSISVNLANISPDLAMIGKIKIAFSDYQSANFPIALGDNPITIEMPKKITVEGLGTSLASIDFAYDIQATKFGMDVNMSIPLLQFNNKDIAACSIALNGTNLNANVDIQNGLRELVAMFGEVPVEMNVDYLVEVALEGMAKNLIPATLYALSEDASSVKIPMGTAVLTLNPNNTFPIEKIDVTSYENGAASDFSLFTLNMVKSNLTSTLFINEYDIDKNPVDTTFSNRTIIAMTDYTSAIPTTSKAAIQNVITRVVSELANEGKATWYELVMQQAKTEDAVKGDEVVRITVSPYMSGTNAIADIDIVADGSAYLVRATADLSGSKKIAVDVIQGETSFATAYFTSNIAGVITSNESVQVSDVKVIPTANAIRVLNADKASYQIYSITGAMMANGTIAGDAYISTANLAKGIYIVVVEANGVKQSVKFIR